MLSEVYNETEMKYNPEATDFLQSLSTTSESTAFYATMWGPAGRERWAVGGQSPSGSWQG